MAQSDSAIRQLKTLQSNTSFPVLIDFLNKVAAFDFKNFKGSLPTLVLTNAVKNKYLMAGTLDAIDLAFSDADYQTTHYLPADLIYLTYHILLLFEEAFTNQLTPAQNKELNNVGGLADAKATLTTYGGLFRQNDEKISYSDEINLFTDFFIKGGGRFSTDVGLIVQYCTARLELATSDQKSPTKAGDEEGSPAKEVATAAVKLGGGAAAAKEKKAEKKALPKTNQLIDQDQQLQLLATSFSHSVLNSVLAAYTADESGLGLISLSNLTPELQQALLNQLRPQIENIILSLSAEELNALAYNTAAASTVRLKILKKSHQFSLNYPPLRVLIQEAFNQGFRSDQINQVDLEQKLKQTTHQRAQENLERQSLLQNQWLLPTKQPEDQPTLESNTFSSLLMSLAQLNRETFRDQFVIQLTNLFPEGGLDYGQLAIAQKNLDVTLSSLIIADPLLSSSFINTLDHTRFQAFFGSFITAEQFQKNEFAIKALFRQYWIFYRAEVNQQFPKLANLSETTSLDQDLTQEQVDGRLFQASQIRTKIMKETDLTDKQSLALLTNRSDPENQEIGSKDKQYVEEFKLNFWKSLSIEEKKEYLTEVGVEFDGDAQKSKVKQNQQLDQLIVNDEGHSNFNYFTYYEGELGRQQQALIQTTANDQQFQAHLLATLYSETFLVPGQELAPEISVSLNQPHLQGATYAPPISQQALATAQQLKSGLKQTVSNLAEMGASYAIDAALTGATGGAWAAIPGFIREPIKGIIIDESKRKIKAVFKAATVVAGGLAFMGTLALAGLISLVKSGVIMAGAALGGSLGFAAGGPAGALFGSGIGGGVSWLGKKLLNNSLFRDTAKKSLTEGASNLKSTSSGLGRLAGKKLGLGFGAKAASTKSSLPAISATAKSAAAKFLHNPALTSVVSTTAIASVGTLVTIAVINSAFLLDFTDTQFYSAINLAGQTSKYLNMEKTAVISSSGNCNQQTTCEQPSFPIEVTYVITISPKDNYQIVITNITDVITINYNEDVYQNSGQKVPNPSLPSKTASDFKLSFPITLDTTDSDSNNDVLAIEYKVNYSQDFNHAIIYNNVTVEFNFTKDLESGSDQAIKSKAIRLGEYPQGEICWPAEGIIFQGPFNTGPNSTHSQVDAYDIVPLRDASGKIISDLTLFAPVDGRLCPGRFPGPSGSNLLDSIYGEHVSLTGNIRGYDYTLTFGHLVSGTALVKTACADVKQGDVIGIMGTTGYSSGIHLHFEKRPSGPMNLTELMTGSPSPIIPNGTRVYSCAEL